MMEGLDSFFIAMFTRILGWRKEEVDVICAQGRKNLRDPKFHAYFTWCVPSLLLHTSFEQR